jgi:hypothetical protein
MGARWGATRATLNTLLVTGTEMGAALSTMIVTSRMRPDGAEYGGQKLSRGALYLILQNRLYRGEISHGAPKAL